MKRSVKLYSCIRRICWILLSPLILLADVKVPRRMMNMAGILLCLVFIILGHTAEPDMLFHKVGYAMLTIALELPWVITFVAFGILCEIECSEYEARKEVYDGHKR